MDRFRGPAEHDGDLVDDALFSLRLVRVGVNREVIEDDPQRITLFVQSLPVPRGVNALAGKSSVNNRPNAMATPPEISRQLNGVGCARQYGAAHTRMGGAVIAGARTQPRQQ